MSTSIVQFPEPDVDIHFGQFHRHPWTIPMGSYSYTFKHGFIAQFTHNKQNTHARD